MYIPRVSPRPVLCAPDHLTPPHPQGSYFMHISLRPSQPLAFIVLSLSAALGRCHPWHYVYWSSVGFSFPLTLSPFSLSLSPHLIYSCILLSKWDLSRQILRIFILCMMLFQVLWEMRSIQHIPCAKVEACNKYLLTMCVLGPGRSVGMRAVGSAEEWSIPLHLGIREVFSKWVRFQVCHGQDSTLPDPLVAYPLLAPITFIFLVFST